MKRTFNEFPITAPRSVPQRRNVYVSLRIRGRTRMQAVVLTVTRRRETTIAAREGDQGPVSRQLNSARPLPVDDEDVGVTWP